MIFRSPLPDVTIPEMSLTQFVLQRSSQLADKPALIDGTSGRRYTYGQFAGAVRLVASSLAKRGLEKGDVFAIYSPNLPEYPIAFHAVASLGGILTTANPLYTAEELAFQLNDARAKFLLTVPPFLDKAIEAAKKANIQEIFVFGEAPGATPFASLLQSDGQVPEVQIDPHKDLVILPYSSGTTGLAKGVMLTHHNIVANLCQWEKYVDEGEHTIIGVLPFFHIYGSTLIMNGTLHEGHTLVTMPRFDLEQFLQICQDYGVTFAPLVPPIVLALTKLPIVDNYDLSKLTKIGCGAAPLGTNIQEACEARLKCEVIQGYGMTETSAAAILNPLGQDKMGSVGKPIPNTEVKIIEPATGAELGPNEQGEIWLRGPQMMQGYLNQPEVSAHTIDNDKWLHTGDIGYADDDGYFYIVDRVKELIKYKGMQVAPAELEALLLSHPAIADTAVIPVPDEEAGEIPKAFVVLKPQVQVTSEDIMAFVAERVAPHKKVRQLEFIDQIPKSLSGKILRRMLVDRERAKTASLT